MPQQSITCFKKEKKDGSFTRQSGARRAFDLHITAKIHPFKHRLDIDQLEKRVTIITQMHGARPFKTRTSGSLSKMHRPHEQCLIFTGFDEARFNRPASHLVQAIFCSAEGLSSGQFGASLCGAIA